MQRVKFFEIRDCGTFIPAVAIDCSLTGDRASDYLLRRAGYGSVRCILLTPLGGGRKAEYDPYNWDYGRTLKIAHFHILDNWDNLKDGDVIDVEHILGEKAEPRISERGSYPC